MNLETMNKQIPTWLAISVILVIASLLAGFILWQEKKGGEDFNWQPSVVKTTQDETAGWKTYRDEAYGFEIKYPTRWEARPFTSGIIIRPPVEPGRRPEVTFIGITSSVVKKLPVGSIVDTNIKRQVRIGEFDFLKTTNLPDCTHDDTCKREDVYSTEKDGVVYTVEFSVEGLPEEAAKKGAGYLSDSDMSYELGILGKILSTFKFTDDFSGWQTYRDEKYGFEFKYPPTLNHVGRQIVLSEINPTIASHMSTTGFDVGPLSFFVLDKREDREELLNFFSELSKVESENVSCHSETINNPIARIQSIVCGSEGGPGFYALIKTASFDVFIDGNASGIDCSNETCGLYKNGSPESEYLGGFKNIDEVYALLSTFKFTNSSTFLYTPAYSNEKFGFQISVPGSKAGYKVVEENKNEFGYYVTFSYKTNDKNFARGYSDVFSVRVWKKDVYVKLEGECRLLPEEDDCPLSKLGSNSEYIFDFVTHNEDPAPDHRNLFAEAVNLYRSKNLGFYSFEPCEKECGNGICEKVENPTLDCPIESRQTCPSDCL